MACLRPRVHFPLKETASRDRQPPCRLAAPRRPKAMPTPSHGEGSVPGSSSSISPSPKPTRSASSIQQSRPARSTRECQGISSRSRSIPIKGWLLDDVASWSSNSRFDNFRFRGMISTIQVQFPCRNGRLFLNLSGRPRLNRDPAQRGPSGGSRCGSARSGATMMAARCRPGPVGAALGGHAGPVSFAFV